MKQNAKIARIANSLNVRKRLREWRIRSNALHALEKSASAFNVLEFVAAIIVLVGIIAEYIPPFIASLHRMVWWRALTTVWPGALVAGGIALETMFSQMIRSRETRIGGILRQQAAETQERAANAERETERIKQKAAWRVIQPLEAATIVSRLQEQPGAVWIDYCIGDFESQYYAQQLHLLFGTVGGWKSVLRGVTPTNLRFGVIVPKPGPNSRASEALVLRAINGCGIQCDVGDPPPWGGHAAMAFGSMDANSAQIAGRIFVGPKFPVMPELRLVQEPLTGPA
jgi:hypothetical protein